MVNKHLNANELRDIVFEDTANKDYSRTEEHVKGCDYCQGLVDEERERNPIYQEFKEKVPGEMTRTQFFDYVSGIQEESLQ